MTSFGIDDIHRNVHLLFDQLDLANKTLEALAEQLDQRAVKLGLEHGISLEGREEILKAFKVLSEYILVVKASIVSLG